MNSTLSSDFGQRSGRCSAQRGFSLLEVLVAIVVLSFGVLGVVGLQAASMQANSEARYQSSAVRYARELGDMMSDNKQTATTLNPATNPYLIANYPATQPTEPPTDCSSVTCPNAADGTNINLAYFQMQDWLDRLSSELPGVRVVVCFDTAPYDANGMPQWACNPPAAANVTPSLVVVKMAWTRLSTNRAATGAAVLDRATDATSKPAVILQLNPG
jgi:type IV pilus assembly protein PilV